MKIGDVLSDIFGLSGQLMLEALVEGKTDHVEIARLAKGGARKKIAELEAALEGHQMRPAHRILIRHTMAHMAFLAKEVEVLDQEVEDLIREAGLTGPWNCYRRFQESAKRRLRLFWLRVVPT